MYTKGKWKAELNLYPETVWATDGKGRETQVAEVTSRNEADAFLIAAAPAMYEALKDIYDFLKSHGYRTDIVREALAEAEGK